jgi:hypothetical protein
MSNLLDISWGQLGSDIIGEAVNNWSGFSVSLSADGTILAIASVFNDSVDGYDSNVGHVRVYKYDATKTTAVTDQTSNDFGPIGWRRLGGDIDGEASSDVSGWSISLSADGTILAIGAHSNDGNGSNSGHTRVYKYDATKNYLDTCQNSVDFGPVGWRRLGQDIDGEASNDQSGHSVSLSADGTILAIGAPYNNGVDGYDSNVGHVRVYKYDVTKITSVTDQTSNDFGPVGWRRLGQDIDGEVSRYSGYSGYSVSLSADGTVVAIGAHSNDGNGDFSGHVRVYKYDATKTISVTDQTSVDFGPVGWRRLGQDIDGEAQNDNSGYSVSLSADGTIVAIGAPGNSENGSNSGHARVYKYDVTKNYIDTCQNSVNFGPVGWRRLGQDIDGQSSGDISGYSVSLSSNGNILAIQSHNTINNLDNIVIYEYNNTQWLQLGEPINTGVGIDWTNTSISLNSNGNIVAIGGPLNDVGGNDIGIVSVYKLIDKNPISNICFPAGTKICTDQGIIEIQNINPNIHTIRSSEIEAITQTITQDKYLVCIEKDAFANNIPSEKILISKRHKLFYNGLMIKAEELLKLNNSGIYKVKYNGEILFNILLKNKYDKMVVNNLICETLDPKNGIAKMYNDIKKYNYSILEKHNLIKRYNEYVIKNKTFE